MSTRFSVVQLGTSGTQRSIFASPRLREQMGASHLVAQLGPWTDEACATLSTAGITASPIVLASGTCTVRIEGPGPEPTEAAARALVHAVTSRALRDAPGLHVVGAHSRALDPATSSLADGLSEAFRAAGASRQAAPPRFQRMPLMVRCSSSDDAATVLHRSTGRALSPGATARFAAGETARATLGALFADAGLRHQTVDELEAEFGEMRWAACTHVDVNGLGLLFGGVGQATREALHDLVGTSDEDASALGATGIAALESAVHASVLQALSEVIATTMVDVVNAAIGEIAVDRGEVPVVPLVLGGDDLTVYSEGRTALALATAILDRLPSMSATAIADRRQDTPERLTNVLTDDDGSDAAALWTAAWDAAVQQRVPEGLGACAGVAVIKPHTPMVSAYRLAEELTRSAKQVKLLDGASCALDFHILYDSVGSEIDAIRGLVNTDPNGDEAPIRRFARPYVVHASAEAGASPWTRVRRWNDLLAARDALLEAIRTNDGPGRRQFWTLRDCILRDPDLAQTAFDEAALRHGATLSALTLDGHLFWNDCAPDGSMHWRTTRALDVLDLVALDLAT